MIYKYNGIDKKCPVPLINLRLLLKKMNGGDECVITINDAGSLKDIPKLLFQQGYDFHQKKRAGDVMEISIKAVL